MVGRVKNHLFENIWLEHGVPGASFLTLPVIWNSVALAKSRQLLPSTCSVPDTAPGAGDRGAESTLLTEGAQIITGSGYLHGVKVVEAAVSQGHGRGQPGRMLRRKAEQRGETYLDGDEEIGDKPPNIYQATLCPRLH